MIAYSHEPIAAIATAPGRGGIGVVRVSGRDLSGLAERLFGQPLLPRHAHYLPFDDGQGQAIDAGIVLFFKGPHSYTGEDVIELQGHGGPAVMRRVLQRCLEAGKDFGLRHAEPGEFTQRAFLNDRLDLAQAEAVADLIDASSEAAARSAMASLSGQFSERINELRDDIVRLRMLVEATLDFPEEEIDFLEKYQAADALRGIRQRVDNLVRQAQQSMVLREGLHVVLAGQPNVGKSSLLNALAGDEVAIVTPIAGTTRDKVVQQIHLQGVPLHIVDTAGLRETDDTVESIGIARSWAEIEKADVIIHMQDARSPGDVLDEAITARLPAGTPVIEVYNKIDLLSRQDQDSLMEGLNLGLQDKNIRPWARFADGDGRADSGNPVTELNAGSRLTLAISAQKGQGLDALREALLSIAGWKPGQQSPWLARERHVQALFSSQEHLELASEHAAQNDSVLDLFAEELRLAHESLSSITGQFTSDDLLGEIFSSFCIGK